MNRLVHLDIVDGVRTLIEGSGCRRIVIADLKRALVAGNFVAYDSADTSKLRHEFVALFPLYKNNRRRTKRLKVSMRRVHFLESRTGVRMHRQVVALEMVNA